MVTDFSKGNVSTNIIRQAIPLTLAQLVQLLYSVADRIYIEPLTIDTLKRIIEKEKPDSVLSTLGGQTGLTLSMQLAKEGFLQQHNVKL